MKAAAAAAAASSLAFLSSPPLLSAAAAAAAAAAASSFDSLFEFGEAEKMSQEIGLNLKFGIKKGSNSKRREGGRPPP